jgi:hypothetical protein
VRTRTNDGANEFNDYGPNEFVRFFGKLEWWDSIAYQNVKRSSAINEAMKLRSAIQEEENLGFIASREVWHSHDANKQSNSFFLANNEAYRAGDYLIMLDALWHSELPPPPGHDIEIDPELPQSCDCRTSFHRLRIY